MRIRTASLRLPRWASRLAPTALVFVVGAWAALAQIVPVGEEPHHRVVFESDAVRVLDVNIPPGTTTLDHRHDHDLLIVSVGAADTRTRAPGADWGPIRPRRVLGETSVTEYVGQPGVHAIRNVGVDPYRLVAVENTRERGWRSWPPATTGAEVVAEARAFRATRVRVKAGDAAVARVHAVPSVVILVSGEAALSRAGGHAVALTPSARWAVVAAGESFIVTSQGAGESQLVAVEVR